MSHSIRKIILLILSSSLIFTVSVGRADDTEIYFSAGSATESVLRPNLLFILDTSGSMIFNTTDSGQTRLDELKDAMEIVLDSLTDVNVGLMRFNDAQPQEGGPVIFPINFIDGIDGLCSGLVLLALIVLVCFIYLSGSNLNITLIGVLLVSILTFLIANIGITPIKKVFLGDAGSMVLGFILSFTGKPFLHLILSSKPR